MFTRHVTRRLARYADGDLAPSERQAVDAHLSRCAACRHDLDEIRFASALVRRLAIVTPPPSVWNGIDAALSQAAPSRVMRLQWALAIVLVLAAAGGAAYVVTRNAAPRPWQVEALTNGGQATRMGAGDVIETGAGSRMRIHVGDVGTVDIEGGSRVLLGDARDTGYRMALERGTLSAQISAPPRIFVVDTPTGTVVDLGCAYTVTVADDGAGLLRMTEGWAALEWNGGESLVPAGAMCRTRPNLGPGMPYFEDAPDALKRAVDAFDGGDRTPGTVDTILREARVRDTLTLWHLLSRVDAAVRAQVYDRLASLVDPPPGVTRDQALQLDPDALRRLREELAWHW
jgi:hypothetical protein